MPYTAPLPSLSNIRLDIQNQSRKRVFALVATTSFILYLSTLVVGIVWGQKINNGPIFEHEAFFNAALLHFGILCGWLIGGIMSPDNKTEEVRFARYSTAIASFISGYLLSKMDGSINLFLKIENWRESDYCHLLIWAIGMLTAMLFTFTLRTYLLPRTSQGNKPRIFELKVPPKELGTAMFGQAITDDTLLHLQVKSGNGKLSVSRLSKPDEEVTQLYELGEKDITLQAIQIGAKGKYFVFQNEGTDPLLLRVKVFAN